MTRTDRTEQGESAKGVAAQMTVHAAPFLAWPVSRRAFYRAIFVSLMPALVWGMAVFGIRPLMMTAAAFLAVTIAHFGLKYSGWKRARCLLLFHSLVGAGILVALSHPTWPAWLVACAALLLPLFFVLLGGPGKEPFHLAIAAVVAIEFLILPSLAGHTYTGKEDALLARDRLFMGDIRNQSPSDKGMAAGWPISRDLGGNDAFRATPAAVGAAETLNAVAQILPSEATAHRAALTPPEVKTIGERFDRDFAFDLPDPSFFAWGIVPGRIGLISLAAIVLAGLHLSYRYILRPRSALLFLIAFFLGTLLVTFDPATFRRVSPAILWDLITHFPGQVLTLFQFLLMGSDALFAAVFILALPGTEPLTPRGRRIFLVAGALASAVMHRYWPAIPAATICLTALMPAAPLFDLVFKHRSWLRSD